MKHRACIVSLVATVIIVASAGSIAQAENDETYNVANTRSTRNGILGAKDEA